MMRNTVGLMNSCMKYQETHIGFKVKYSRKKILCILTLQEEETSTLMVGLEEEDKHDAWVEVEVISFVITAHNQDTW